MWCSWSILSSKISQESPSNEHETSRRKLRLIKELSTTKRSLLLSVENKNEESAIEDWKAMTEMQYGELVSSDPNGATEVEKDGSDFRGTSQNQLEAVLRKLFTVAITFSIATLFHLLMIKVLCRFGRNIPSALLFPKPQVSLKSNTMAFSPKGFSL